MFRVWVNGLWEAVENIAIQTNTNQTKSVARSVLNAKQDGLDIVPLQRTLQKQQKQ